MRYRQNLAQQIIKQFDGITLPRGGVSGFSAEELKYRRMFTGARAAFASKALYRALYALPDDRKAAEDYIYNHTEVELGITADEYNALCAVLKLPREKPESHVTINVSLRQGQIAWLESREGGRSAAAQLLIDEARASGQDFRGAGRERKAVTSLGVRGSQARWLEEQGSRSEVMSQIIDAAQGGSSPETVVLEPRHRAWIESICSEPDMNKAISQVLDAVMGAGAS